MRSGRLGASPTHRGAGCTATPSPPAPRPIKTQAISAPPGTKKTKPGEAGAAAVFTSAQSMSGSFSRHSSRSRSGTPQWMGGPPCDEHGNLFLHSFKNTGLVRSDNKFCLHLPLNRERDDLDEPLDFGCIPFSDKTKFMSIQSRLVGQPS